MPRTKTGKGAGGAGSIRKIATTKNGKTYTYWQGRYTEGFDPGTGKQIQRSITGKTQKEVAQKLKQVTLDIDNGVYHAPCKLTLTQWLEIWSKTYLGGVKPRTAQIYKSDIKLHVLPAMGAVRLEALNAPMIQAFYNAMGESSEQNPEGLVFTNEFGTHLTKPTVYREYKRIVAAIGCPDARFHDLRHSYAVAAIRAGDDIKTVQGNLGHATAAFTLDVYGHVTDQMKRESADRMERFIRTVSAG